MSLLEPRVLTPAQLQANRRNAQRSTNPRTAPGKARSRLSGMRHGHCSPQYRQFWYALFEATPGCPAEFTVDQTLAVQEALHPVYSNLIKVHSEMKQQDLEHAHQLKRRGPKGQARAKPRSY